MDRTLFIDEAAALLVAADGVLPDSRGPAADDQDAVRLAAGAAVVARGSGARGIGEAGGAACALDVARYDRGAASAGPRQTFSVVLRAGRDAHGPRNHGATRMAHYLGGENESLLFTDYAIEEATVLAGALETSMTRTPGAATPPLLTVWGGDLTIDGIRLHGPDTNFVRPQDGSLHLLFLRVSRARQAGKYEVWDAGIFELSGERMKPLLRKATERVFAWAADLRVSEALARIRGVRR
jgi:hypothetical protein